MLTSAREATTYRSLPRSVRPEPTVHPQDVCLTACVDKTKSNLPASRVALSKVKLTLVWAGTNANYVLGMVKAGWPTVTRSQRPATAIPLGGRVVRSMRTVLPASPYAAKALRVLANAHLVARNPRQHYNTKGSLYWLPAARTVCCRHGIRLEYDMRLGTRKWRPCAVALPEPLKLRRPRKCRRALFRNA